MFQKAHSARQSKDCNSQDSKFSWLRHEDRPKHKAEHKTCHSCKIATAKDQKAVPSAYCKRAALANGPRKQSFAPLSETIQSQGRERRENVDRVDRGEVWTVTTNAQISRICLKETCNLRANQPSSSSLRLGAGSGAPGPSFVGNWT